MDQWHPIVKLLHWLMAVLLISMLGIGFAMIWLANQAAHSDDYSARMLGVSIFDAYQLHKSIGVTLFTMLIVRLAVRWVTVPAHHGDLASFERTASKLVQTALYALMLALPLAGWPAGWILAASPPLGLPTVVFGLFHLPHPVGPSATAEAFWGWLHCLGGLALTALAAMHVAAALKHHFWNRDSVLRSMLPFQTGSKDRKSK